MSPTFDGVSDGMGWLVHCHDGMHVPHVGMVVMGWDGTWEKTDCAQEMLATIAQQQPVALVWVLASV